MKFVVKDTTEEISHLLAMKILSLVKSNPKAVLGLATGGSPLGTYREISRMQKGLSISFANVTTFNLDEYIGEIDPRMTYRYYMDENLFCYLDIKPQNTYFPAETTIHTYDDLIQRCGGIDLQILGIGANGHIAFNEPNTPFYSLTHIVKLDKQTRKDNARFFPKPSDVPTEAVCMGLSSILKAKEIVLLVLGENKIDSLKRLIDKTISEDFPASILHLHANVTVYTTTDLYSRATKTNDKVIASN